MNTGIFRFSNYSEYSGAEPDETTEACRIISCSGRVSLARWKLGYRTCMECAEKIARQQKHCIVPMHKSNYVLVTKDAAPELLRGINNKYVR